MKIRVDESYVDALINNAAWDTAKIKLDEKKELSPAQKKMDQDGDGDIEGDDLAKLRNKGKAKKSEPEKQEESVDEHICPLCESVLEEELSDDQIFEHVNEILGALENLNEAADEEDDDDDVDEAMDDEEDPKEMKKKMKEKKKDDLDELASSAMDDRETGGDQKDALDKARDSERGGKDEAMMNASKKSKKEAVMKKVKELKKSAKKA